MAQVKIAPEVAALTDHADTEDITSEMLAGLPSRQTYAPLDADKCARVSGGRVGRTRHLTQVAPNGKRLALLVYEPEQGKPVSIPGSVVAHAIMAGVISRVEIEALWDKGTA